MDLDEAALQEIVEFIGEDKASYTVADVTRPEDTQAYVDEAAQRWGGVDVLLANAGIEGTLAPIPDYPIDEFDRVMAVNVRGVWLGIKYVTPVMRERGGGSIVITSSTAGIGGSPEMSAYNTSKHAVIGLMRCAALEGAPLGIRVNTVNPAPIETRIDALNRRDARGGDGRYQGDRRSGEAIVCRADTPDAVRRAGGSGEDDAVSCQRR